VLHCKLVHTATIAATATIAGTNAVTTMLQIWSVPSLQARGAESGVAGVAPATPV